MDIKRRGSFRFKEKGSLRNVLDKVCLKGYDNIRVVVILKHALQILLGE